ncbi:MAG: hypothetical protein STSR0008_14100 [Ignavibacterium sp.]
MQFPIINNIPVLVNDCENIFLINDFFKKQKITLSIPIKFTRFIPSLGNNLTARKNIISFKNIIFSKTNSPKVLVLGGE